MLSGQVQHPPGVALRAWADNLTQLRAMQVHHHGPARSDDVHMSGRVIAQVDDEAQPADAEDRRHHAILHDGGQNPSVRVKFVRLRRSVGCFMPYDAMTPCLLEVTT
jgi:hypothetical protein